MVNEREHTLFITEVGLEEVRVVFCHESICPLCVPKLELPPRGRVELCATGIGDDPFLLHLQISETGLVNDSRNNLWCVLWGDEILEVPPISITEDDMGQKGESEEGVEQREENRQSMVEDDYENGEKTNTTVVVPLEGERR